MERKILADIPVSMIAPRDFVEHELHKNFFLDPEKKKKKQSYYDSVAKFGKVKPVVFVEVGGQKMVIDGWSFVQYANSVGMPAVAAYRLNLTDDKEIARIMLELQFSDHNSLAEEYKIYKAAYDLFGKGKGYRSDLDESMEKVVELTMENKNSDRRPSVYDKIATMTSASSGKRVSQIIKIGDERPALLERIETGVMSVYGAYKSVTKKDKPKINVSAKNLTDKNTKEVSANPKEDIIAAAGNNATGDLIATHTAGEEALKNQMSIEAPMVNISENDGAIKIQTVCSCCFTKLHILFTKELLNNNRQAA